MKIVIQCAASKAPEAGTLRTQAGMPVMFVADPASAPMSEGCVYARPDDLAEDGRSWREILLAHNRQAGNNPFRLIPAFRLYTNGAYRQLVERLGRQNVFILSAGWGLIPADFLTPAYTSLFRNRPIPTNAGQRALLTPISRCWT